MGKLIMIGIGGFSGAIARYLLSGLVAYAFGGSFPYGTLLVNSVGSFLLGFIMVWGIEIYPLNQNLRLLLTTGLLGALTTFSTFSFETFNMISEHSYGMAALNITSNVLLTIAFVWLGMTLARVLM